MLMMDTGFSPELCSGDPDGNSLFFAFREQSALLSGTEDRLSLPRFSQIKPFLPQGVSLFCLGSVESRPVFCLDPFADAFIPETEALHYHKMRISRALPLPEAGWLYTAWHLWSWYRRNRHCGLCGSGTAFSVTERALVCTKCGQPFYPVISPAVIVAITCGDYLLQVSTTYGEKNRFALVAGYVEAGETLEHAVRREAMEETGLELKNLEYLGNQPWGFSGALMFAFHAEADRHAPLTLQESEIAAARWIHRKDLPMGDNPVSVSYSLIEQFLNGKW
ncbi:MAG: NAD(+) diphosphatase [Clostridiales bacterium]|nr:NAD(+) diphosphatase [Clostridiales bacterium]